MIEENIVNIREIISDVCSKRDIDASEIRLVAVSKTVPVELIKSAINFGITEIGENRVQEAEQKFSCLQSEKNIIKHLVGHLQTNKAKKAVHMFDLVQSVDSLRVAIEIDKQARKINKIQDCLIEVKISEEETKYGIDPEKLPELVNQVNKLENIKLRGLMTIAPFLDDPERTRSYFCRTKQIFDEIKAQSAIPSPQFSILSMGMTDDFRIAIEEGANMVRIGRAIFCERNE